MTNAHSHLQIVARDIVRRRGWLRSGDWIATLVVTLVAISGCDLRGATASSQKSAASGKGEDPESVSPTLHKYPPGQWRLLSFEERDRITLWVSHILIMHESSRPENASFLGPLGWTPGKSPGRTVAAARSLALEVARQARQNPGEFASLAARYSDDLTTRGRGGSLGGRRTSQIPAAFLDALETMEPGRTSDAIATPLGCHVLLLRRPPADQLIAGQRAVVRYFGTLGPSPSPPRSRTEALQIAEKLVHDARTSPDGFGKLIKERSEGEDARRDGDMGVWSVRDPGEAERETEALDALPINGISEPLDTTLGFQVLQRLAPEERDQYAVAMIWVPYEWSGRSREEVHASARSLLSSLRDGSADFHDARTSARYGSSVIQAYTRGRGPVAVEAAVLGLDIGQFAPNPIETGDALVVAKRINLDEVPLLPPMRYTLPRLVELDMDSVIAGATSASLAAMTRELAGALQAELKLQSDLEKILMRELGDLAIVYSNTSDTNERLQETARMRERLTTALGPDASTRVTEFIKLWARNKKLTSPTL